MAKISFAAKVRKLFDEHNKLTIKEIQEVLSKDPEIEVPKNQLNHRIRSAIYSLHKNEEIIRVGDSTYRKN